MPKTDVHHNKHLHIRIPGELKDRFTAICKKEAINPSRLVRKLVEDWMEESEEAEE